LSSLYALGNTSRSVTHPEIAPGQAHLTLEFFAGGLPEKKLQLSGISILLILLSRGDVTAMELADQEGDDGMTEPEDEGKMTLSEDLVGKIKEMKRRRRGIRRLKRVRGNLAGDL
jgi:hypothetical protein